LLLLVIQTESESKKALSTIAALIRMHLISHLDLKWVVPKADVGIPNAQKAEIKAPQLLNCRYFEGRWVFENKKLCL
jgi:hypothetical protein